MKKLIIYGTGELAEVADYYFGLNSDYNTEYFMVDKDYANSTTFNGKPVILFEDLENNNSFIKDYYFFTAIGFSSNNTNRKNIFKKLNTLGANFANFISEDAIVAENVSLGKNLFILEQNNIQPFCNIGDNVIMWSGNHIGHHSNIGAHCFITSHVVVSGGVEIGESSFLGVNSTIVDHVSLKNKTFVKANSLIAYSN